MVLKAPDPTGNGCSTKMMPTVRVLSTLLLVSLVVVLLQFLCCGSPGAYDLLHFRMQTAVKTGERLTGTLPTVGIDNHTYRSNTYEAPTITPVLLATAAGLPDMKNLKKSLTGIVTLQGNTSGIVAISAIEKEVEQSTKLNRYLTCDDIKNLEIVRTLSTGMNKVVLEVTLPGSGASAVAKRCFKSEPRLQRLLRKETNFLKGLQEQYGTENTLGYFGECYASSNKLFGEMLKQGMKMDHILRNFSVGYTSIVEMGTPLLLNGQLLKGKGHTCSLPSRKCFAEYFTESDVEDLKMMARLYANYSEGPITLRHRKNTDNCKAEQYVATTTGLRHVDLEMAYLRKRSELTYSESLEINCSVLRILFNNKTLDCTTSVPIGKQQMNHHRINTTAAVDHCSLPPETGSEQHSGKKTLRRFN